MKYVDQQWRGTLSAAVLMAVGLSLSGCSGGSISNPLPSVTNRLPSWFGGSSATQASAAAPGEAPAPSMEEDCPVADIRRGASTLQIANKTEGATASDLRYQLTFNELARQCTRVGPTVRMRVGVQGRVIVGPAGAPSQVDVPLRYAVVREGVEPKTVVTKFRRLPVVIPPGADNAVFTDIEEDLSFPMPSYSELQKYVVYVGFDEVGDRATRRPAAKKRR
jgi:hypothetical protein